MSLVLTTVEKLRHTDGKAYWEIRGNDITMIGDRRFVKLPCKSTSGFHRICADRTAGAVACLPLIRSIGYTDLVMRRNKLQSESLVQQQAAKVPSMFRSTFKPIARVAVATRKDAKAHPDSMEMIIPSFGEYDELAMMVMRPIAEREDLVVEFNPTVIGRVIAYIRDQGFLDAADPLPWRVYKRKNARHPYQYIYVDRSGKRSRHFATSLEAAIMGVECGPPPDDEAAAYGGDDADDCVDDDPDGEMHAEHDESDGESRTAGGGSPV